MLYIPQKDIHYIPAAMRNVKLFLTSVDILLRPYMKVMLQDFYCSYVRSYVWSQLFVIRSP